MFTSCSTGSIAWNAVRVKEMTVTRLWSNVFLSGCGLSRLGRKVRSFGAKSAPAFKLQAMPAYFLFVLALGGLIPCCCAHGKGRKGFGWSTSRLLNLALYFFLQVVPIVTPSKFEYYV